MHFRWIALIALALGAIGLFSLLAVGDALTKPALRNVGAPPAEFPAEPVSFTSSSGGEIHGWLARGQPGRGALLLLHPLRSDRRSMLGRAVFLHQLGYTVLLIDFQAHGESLGARITFGAREARDVEAAVSYLTASVPGEPIGVLGVSLGGVAILLAKQPLPVQAVILESVYPTIEEAVDDRLRLHLGSLGPMLAPLLLVQLKPGLGVSPGDLRPISHISQLGAPLFLIHGANDQHTTAAEAAKLFAAASDPKELWVISGAAHVDLHAFTSENYRARVGDFLSRYLHRAD